HLLEPDHSAAILRERMEDRSEPLPQSGPGQRVARSIGRPFAQGARCPLLAQCGRRAVEFQCPLLGVKRTSTMWSLFRTGQHPLGPIQTSSELSYDCLYVDRCAVNAQSE